MARCDGMVHLRRARHADARAIAEVHVATWRDSYRDLVPAAYLDALSIEGRERYWANELAVLPADRQPWLAESESELVGFISVGPSRDDGAPSATGEVYAIYVRRECWDRGVGRNLLHHGERDLTRHGYDEATLWVLEGNRRARSFYEAAGWTHDGEVKVEQIGDTRLREVRYRRMLQRSRVA